MSSAGARLLRASALALIVVGLAPAASAVGQVGSDDPSGTSPVSAATLRAVSETGAPAVLQIWVDESIKAHEKAREDQRVAKLIEAKAAKLKPGSYVWHPEYADKGRIEMVVSIEAQRAWVYRGGRLIGITTVSTGREGHDTPVGRFPVIQKKKMHFSNLYDNAPMPNMQRLTWDGIALHAGALPGYPASHGCVRLPSEFSKLLYGATRMDDVVHIIAEEPTSAFAALDHAVRSAGVTAFRQGAKVGARAMPGASGSTKAQAR